MGSIRGRSRGEWFMDRGGSDFVGRFPPNPRRGSRLEVIRQSFFYLCFPPNPRRAGLIGSNFGKRQSREIFVASIKVQFARCSAPKYYRVSVRCTFLEPINPARRGSRLEVVRNSFFCLCFPPNSRRGSRSEVVKNSFFYLTDDFNNS